MSSISSRRSFDSRLELLHDIGSASETLTVKRVDKFQSEYSKPLFLPRELACETTRRRMSRSASCMDDLLRALASGAGGCRRWCPGRRIREPLLRHAEDGERREYAKQPEREHRLEQPIGGGTWYRPNPASVTAASPRFAPVSQGSDGRALIRKCSRSSPLRRRARAQQLH